MWIIPKTLSAFVPDTEGLRLGIRRAGVDVRTVCNVEIEAFVQANLVAKTEQKGLMDNAPIYSDLKTFPAREFRGKVHGLIGGYPCQPFSSAGKRQGEKDPRHLWPYILKHVRAIRPVWCFWENVRAHHDGAMASPVRFGRRRLQNGVGYILSGRSWRSTPKETSASSWPTPKVQDSRGSWDRGKSMVTWGNRCMGHRQSPWATPTSKRPHRGSENCEGEQSEVLGERLESDELANPTSREPRQSQARNGGQDTSGGSEEIHEQWPARPGEEQYEWEEPRVTEAQSKLGGEWSKA